MKRQGERKRSAADPALAALFIGVTALVWASLLDTAFQRRASTVEIGCGPGGASLTMQETGPGGRCDDMRLEFLSGRPMDLNRAGAKELMMIDGVGPKTAESVIDARSRAGRFSGPRGLAEIPGLNRRVLAALDEWTEVR